MHTEIKYEGPEAVKQAKAMDDVREWLGDRFAIIEDQFGCSERLAPRHFCFLMSISGISGYPVYAFYKHLWPEYPCSATAFFEDADREELPQ